MASDTGADTGRNFRGSDIHQMIPDTFTFSGRNRDAGKWHKQAVSTDYLKQLTFVHIHRINAVIVDDRTKPRAGKGDFCMRIFALQQISVIAGGKGIFAEIVKTEQGGEADSTHTAH